MSSGPFYIRILSDLRHSKLMQVQVISHALPSPLS